MSKMKALDLSLKSLEHELNILANQLVSRHIAIVAALESKNTKFILDFLGDLQTTFKAPSSPEVLSLSDIATQLQFLDQEITAIISDHTALN